MNFFLFTIYLAGLLFIVAWRAILQPMGFPLFPIGALMALPLIFFSWRETLFFVLTLSLLWEAPLASPLGWVSIPLMVGCLLMQMFARHLFRANFITLSLASVALQSIVIICIEILHPPRTIAGAVLQMSDTILQLLLGVILSSLWISGITLLAKKRFNINLQARIKDL